MKQACFFAINGEVLERFRRLKTETQMAMHGPLAAGQPVPLHQHDEAALYLVEQGSATYVNGITLELGAGSALNAVYVPAGKQHGWQGLVDDTRIAHVFGQDAIGQVLLT